MTWMIQTGTPEALDDVERRLEAVAVGQGGGEAGRRGPR